MYATNLEKKIKTSYTFKESAMKKFVISGTEIQKVRVMQIFDETLSYK